MTLTLNKVNPVPYQFNYILIIAQCGFEFVSASFFIWYIPIIMQESTHCVVIIIIRNRRDEQSKLIDAVNLLLL